MSSTNSPRLPWRPSEYKPEYCDMLVNHMAEGGSYEGFAGVIDCCKQTLYTWEKLHPDFLDAKKKAWARNRLFMDKMGLALMTGKFKGNVVPWVMEMKNRHGLVDNPQHLPEIEGLEFLNE